MRVGRAVTEACVDAAHADVRLVVRRVDLLDAGLAGLGDLLALERRSDPAPPPGAPDRGEQVFGGR
jgi:hypothetical protein